jgi:hypothetical protein
MPSVESIQRGSLTIEQADGTSGTISISSVDISNSFVTHTNKSPGTDTSYRNLRYSFTVEFTSSTQLTWTRHSQDFASTVTLDWEVTEFASGQLERAVQRGRINNVDNAATSSEDVLITVSSVSNSFVTQCGNTAQLDEGFQCRADITSTSNLRFQGIKGTATTNEDVAYEVVEFKSANITSSQRIQAGGTDLNESTETVDAVTLGTTLGSASNAIIFHQGFTADRANRTPTRWALTSTTTATCTRSSPGSYVFQTDATAVVIEFSDSPTIQRGSLTIANTTTSNNSGAYSSTAANRTTRIDGVMTNTSSGGWASGWGDGEGSARVREYFTESAGNITDINVDRIGSTGARTAEWQTIEWPEAASGNPTFGFGPPFSVVGEGGLVF